MSIWGHIAGVIRIDGMSIQLSEEVYTPPKDPPVSLGIMSPDSGWEYTKDMSDAEKEAYYKVYDDNWRAARNSGIPMGSEGSVKWEYSCRKIGDIQYHGTYTITGDLRDYEDAEPVIAWLKQIKTKVEVVPGCWLRQVAVQIEIEGKEPIFVGLDENNEIAKYTVAANGVLIYAKS